MSINVLEELPKSPFESVKLLEKELSMPRGFYEALQDEDDWQFIEKIYQFIDKAISFLVSEALNVGKPKKEAIQNIISKLGLSNSTTSRMAFVRGLELLDTQYQNLIVELIKIKDYFDKSNPGLHLTLLDYINQSKYKGTSDNFAHLTQVFCLGIQKVEFDDRKLSNEDYLRENPKKVIWYAGLVCLAVIFVKRNNFLKIRELQEVKNYKLGQLDGVLLILNRLGISFDKPELQKSLSIVEQFSKLITLRHVNETRITRFLIQPANQFIITIAFLARKVFAERKCIWVSEEGKKPIKPDFFTEQPNGFSDIVEFKLPTSTMASIVGIENRETFNAQINRYISQTRSYRQYFEDSSNREYVFKKHGIKVLYPTRYLVIGRQAMFSTHEWKVIENDYRDLRIKTYDDILNSVKDILDIARSALTD